MNYFNLTLNLLGIWLLPFIADVIILSLNKPVYIKFKNEVADFSVLKSVVLPIYNILVFPALICLIIELDNSKNDEEIEEYEISVIIKNGIENEHKRR